MSTGPPSSPSEPADPVDPGDPDGEDRPLPPNVWVRRNKGLEFDRVVVFTDAVFAIALTLLIVTIGAPKLIAALADDPRHLWDALGDMLPQFVSFFLAFVLIGRYWMAHHVFIGQLRAIDERFVGLNMIYLAFVAFLPFPTSLVGDYEQNPVSIIVFAIVLAAVSGMETVLFHYAYRHDLLRRRISHGVYRYEVIGSLTPVVVFIVTLPLAFISTTLTLMSWIVVWPIGVALDKRAPQGADRYRLGGDQD